MKKKIEISKELVEIMRENVSYRYSKGKGWEGVHWQDFEVLAAAILERFEVKERSKK